MQILEGHVLMDMFLKIYSKLLCKSKAWGQSHLLIIEGITRNVAFLSNHIKTLQNNIVSLYKCLLFTRSGGRVYCIASLIQ
jgi:hypothetical protein